MNLSIQSVVTLAPLTWSLMCIAQSCVGGQFKEFNMRLADRTHQLNGTK